ncbi:hypothetical protein ULMS_00790 [Patiriisocius marinistellae]|uniref:Uncharacterized protein n=1 Tax=Patiriisocius marinistellae TaxID=2494560 RepID=A0A5J4FY09_9FLAO|nr:hypothetical protein [Patiriisocius marinistellae]GEQ84571.1 hypothetical protein ULMS_00790 [Patiriisocius marinistellae]
MESKKEGLSNGCLWIFLTFILTVVAFGVIKFAINLPNLITLFIAILLSLTLTFKILGKPSIKSILFNVTILIIVFSGLNYLGGFWNEIIHQNDTAVFTEEESVATDTIFENNNIIPVFTSRRNWKDNYGNPYTGNLTVRQKDYDRLKNHIATFRYGNEPNFWGNLYNYIDEKDTPSLDLVMNTFKEIHAEKKLNQMEFAEMVVSCIQDIPYSFVFQDDCLPADNYEDAIKDILKDCPDCCIGDVLYGVQNPVSFIKNLKGDCDTRTMLIYSILNYFNYDVAIANSDFYRHSIIGINIAATGKNKKYKGKTYMLWETTSKHFKIGVLPATSSDVKHWNIVLTSK